MEKCVAFLLDADNLNDPVAVDEAFLKLHEMVGQSTVRRAYGSAANLKGLAGVLGKFAIRPCTNFVLEKNTTDVALVVDAMEIACTQQLSVMALGTGDADFYPLVIKLRERGVRVIGFSLNGKMSAEVNAAYDEVIFVGRERPEPLRSAAAKTPSVTALPRLPVAAKTDAASKEAKKTVVKKAAAKKTAAVKAPAAKKVLAKKGAATTATIRQILDTVPGLRAGQPIHLREAARLLHDAKLLGKSAPSTKLFGKYPTEFELTPKSQPSHVRWLGRSSGR